MKDFGRWMADQKPILKQEDPPEPKEEIEILWVPCCVCGCHFVFEGNKEDYDPDSNDHYCGGSPRCCP